MPRASEVSYEKHQRDRAEGDQLTRQQAQSNRANQRKGFHGHTVTNCRRSYAYNVGREKPSPGVPAGLGERNTYAPGPPEAWPSHRERSSRHVLSTFIVQISSRRSRIKGQRVGFELVEW